MDGVAEEARDATPPQVLDDVGVDLDDRVADAKRLQCFADRAPYPAEAAQHHVAGGLGGHPATRSRDSRAS